MITPKFKARVNFKSLIYDDIEHKKLGEYLKSLLGQEVSVVIKPWKEKDARSNNQNRYYFSCIVKAIADETGHSSDDIHNFLKTMFLKKWITIITAKGKKEIEIVQSTTDLKTDSFETYAAECRQWASLNLNMYIGLPNEYDINY